MMIRHMNCWLVLIAVMCTTVGCGPATRSVSPPDEEDPTTSAENIVDDPAKLGEEIEGGNGSEPSP